MTKEVYTRQEAIEDLAEAFASNLTTGDKDDYIALYEIARRGHRGFDDYSNKELKDALTDRYDDPDMEFEVI